jgi:hypothetical protein
MTIRIYQNDNTTHGPLTACSTANRTPCCMGSDREEANYIVIGRKVRGVAPFNIRYLPHATAGELGKDILSC